MSGVVNMTEIGPFVSVSEEAHPFVQKHLYNMVYVGQSQDRKLYWNKGLFSTGLLCGSLIQQIDSVALQFANAHLVKHTSNPTNPRILVLHTGHHPEHQSPFSALDAMHVLSSPRSASRTSNHRPLSLREQDISLRHILALFTPPPNTDGTLSSRILTSIQYVVSRLQTPFDLQNFIQLIEEEKWNEESSTFVALRQTILTGLLAPDEMDAGYTLPPLHSLDMVTIDLSDPILRSMQLEGVLMDMALCAFLNGAINRDERTLIVLSAAHEYLHTSSPLLDSLQWLTSQQDRGISILINTTNPAALYNFSLISNSIDYVAVIGPTRSRIWLEPLKAHSISTEMPELVPSTFSRDKIVMLSPKSQHLQRVEDAEHWTEWGDMFMSFDVDKSKRGNFLEQLDDQTEQPTGSNRGVPTMVSGKESGQIHQDVRSTKNNGDSHKTVQLETEVPSNPPVNKIGLQGYQPSIDDPGFQRKPEINSRLDQNRVQVESKNRVLVQRKGSTTRDSDSDSVVSFRGQETSRTHTYDVSGTHSSTNAKGLNAKPLFHLASDLSPIAFIKTPVKADMYPAKFGLLVSQILGSTNGYSNTRVNRASLKMKMNPIIKGRKGSGSPLGFKNFNKMVEKAWLTNIVRFSTNEADSYVYLVNPASIQERLSSSKPLEDQKGIGWEPPAEFTPPKTSPFLPIVNAIACNGGSVAGVQVPLKVVRQHVGDTDYVLSLGFLKMARYLDEAVRVQLVTVHGIADRSVGRTISLRENWDYLKGILAPER